MLAHPQHQQQVATQVGPLVPRQLHVIRVDGVAVQQAAALKAHLGAEGSRSTHTQVGQDGKQLGDRKDSATQK